MTDDATAGPNPNTTKRMCRNTRTSYQSLRSMGEPGYPRHVDRRGRLLDRACRRQQHSQRQDTHAPIMRTTCDSFELAHDPAVDHRDPFGLQAPGVLPLVTAHEAAVGPHHPPPGEATGG